MTGPEDEIDKATAQAWTALEAVRAMPGSQDKHDDATRLSREMREVADTASAIAKRQVLRVYDEDKLSIGALAQRFNMSKTRAAQIIKERDKLITDEEEDIVTEPSTAAEPVPVVAAIVTSHEGVLIGRRNDGKPPWTFIAGKIEPGESPADAAVREVKEETGLRIKAGGVIGRRVHPRTGRTMVYIAAQPTHGTEVFVGDEEELAEVRWVSLASADELTGNGIYEPVRQHLKHILGNGTAEEGTEG